MRHCGGGCADYLKPELHADLRPVADFAPFIAKVRGHEAEHYNAARGTLASCCCCLGEDLISLCFLAFNHIVMVAAFSASGASLRLLPL